MGQARGSSATGARVCVARHGGGGWPAGGKRVAGHGPGGRIRRVARRWVAGWRPAGGGRSAGGSGPWPAVASTRDLGGRLVSEGPPPCREYGSGGREGGGGGCVGRRVALRPGGRAGWVAARGRLGAGAWAGGAASAAGRRAWCAVGPQVVVAHRPGGCRRLSGRRSARERWVAACAGPPADREDSPGACGGARVVVSRSVGGGARLLRGGCVGGGPPTGGGRTWWAAGPWVAGRPWGGSRGARGGQVSVRYMRSVSYVVKPRRS